MTIFYRLFNTHFQLVSESQLDDYFSFEGEISNKKYYAEDFEDLDKDDDFFCQQCHLSFPLKKGEREITELFGNSVLDIETKATCNHCGHLNDHHIRFKKGFFMVKENNEWMCMLKKHPLVIEWFLKIKSVFI